MKKAQIFLTLCLIGSSAAAQIIDPKKTAERKATDRANSRVDQTIDKGIDKVEEGIGSLFKKKPKKEPQEDSSADQTSRKAEAREEADSEKKTSKDTGTASASFTSYSKFDFVPGEKVIALEDFGQDAIGDFPAKWNTDGAGEVVTIHGKEGKWLKFTGEGSFYPEFIGVIDENCTMEFEMGTSEAHQVLARMFFCG